MELSGMGLLLAAALGSSVLLLVISFLQLIKHETAHVGWLSGLLAFVAIVATIALLVPYVFVAEQATTPPLGLAVWGGIYFLIGSAEFWLMERRRDGFQPENSFGLLLGGIGVLMIVVTFAMPILFIELNPTPVLADEVADVMATASPTATPTVYITPTPSPTATETFTPTLRPTATATPTRERYSTPTPIPSPTVEVYCSAVVAYNLNLREGPSTETAAFDLIPFETVVQVGGSNAVGDWLFVKYGDEWGWVAGEYVTLDSYNCEAIPTVGS